METFLQKRYINLYLQYLFKNINISPFHVTTFYDKIVFRKRFVMAIPIIKNIPKLGFSLNLHVIYFIQLIKFQEVLQYLTLQKSLALCSDKFFISLHRKNAMSLYIQSACPSNLWICTYIDFNLSTSTRCNGLQACLARSEVSSMQIVYSILLAVCYIYATLSKSLYRHTRLKHRFSYDHLC